MKNYLIILTVLFIGNSVIAQDCNCEITEVETNSVSPCTYTIGTVITVTNKSEFKNAVNQANNSGGNMTILIADGTYQVASPSWYPYITASNVVFRSLSGNRDAVILTGTGMVDVSPGVEIGIYAVGDNITIADLTIKGIGNHGISVTGDNLYVYNVKIQNTYEQMLKGNSSANGINNGVVKCSLFEYTNGIGPNWYIGGLDIHTGKNWTVSDNVFKGIASPAGSVAEHAVHFWNASADNSIERNKIVNCDRGIGFGLGTGSAKNTNNGGIIKNNMITNDGTNPFNDVGIGLESSPNTKVYNNSIYIAYPNAIEYRFTPTTNVKISNNLTNKLIQSRNGGTATLTTNMTDAISSWFVNTAAGDLRLNDKISEVVDMGTTLEEVSVDIDSINRPQYSNYDIGAFEYPDPSDNSGDAKFTVYPIPATTDFTLKSDLSDIITIVIYNSIGQKIALFPDVSLQNGYTVDVINWNEGIYYCSVIFSNKDIETVKIMVSK